MNSLQELRTKWRELDSRAQNIWIFAIVLACFLLSWQAYSNYIYHRTQSANALNARISTTPKAALDVRSSAIAGSGALKVNDMLASSYLPQTSRNLGLEDLKADFDYTRQVVADSREELRQLLDQNKQLQAKIVSLEQFRQASSQPVANNAANLTQANASSSASRVDLKSVLPSPVDFTQTVDAGSPPTTIPTIPTIRWTDSDLRLGKHTAPLGQPNGHFTDSTDSPTVESRHTIRQWSVQAPDIKSEATVKQTVTIPATSVIDAVMLSGINARTSATGGTTGGSIISANNVGSPFISRVKGAAILPNGWRVADLTDCFLSGTGIGILSTERANVTADKLTCINSVGLIFEAKIKAYGVDLDGIQGLSGRLVTKQGTILAKEAAAGMFAGVGSAFSPQALPSYNSSATSGAQQGYVLPNTSLIAGSAVGQGVSTSLGQLSKFYLDYARQMFPIVEVNAGTRISWVVQESFDLVFVASK